MFLTPTEIVDLSGYHRFADQRKWLTAHGWTFVVAATGRPVVSRAHADLQLNGAPKLKKSWEPNMRAFTK